MTTTAGFHGQTSLPWNCANPARRRHLVLVPALAVSDDDLTTADAEAADVHVVRRSHPET